MSDPLQPTRRIDVVRVSGEGRARIADAAAVEEPLDIRVHGETFAIVMRTPGDDRALAAGFLFAERVIRDPSELGAVEHCHHPDREEVHHVVEVFLRGAAVERLPALLAGRRRVTANSSCGICGRTSIEALGADLEPLGSTAQVEAATILSLPDRLRSTQHTFDETGGLHGAALFGLDGGLISAAEDVGRHNAVDKLVGRMVIDERFVEDALLMVSGRVSFEIVQKAWLARVPVLAAVSAPTSLAVELAIEAGITLIGFVRGEGFNVYSHPARIASG